MAFESPLPRACVHQGCQQSPGNRAGKFTAAAKLHERALGCLSYDGALTRKMGFYPFAISLLFTALDTCLLQSRHPRSQQYSPMGDKTATEQTGP